ncbi:hypothetical protein GGR54DRAFT_591016 [Hypoxylon sp. NC1633]|nr:hypothetical protein GGR54DRAFT_591016 [Hypoxylon sp. NC1633]
MSGSNSPIGSPKSILRASSENENMSSVDKTNGTNYTATATVAFDEVARDIETGERVWPSTRSHAEYMESVIQRRGYTLIDVFRARAMEMDEKSQPSDENNNNAVAPGSEGQVWDVVLYKAESDEESESDEVSDSDEDFDSDEESFDDGGIEIVFDADPIDDEIEDEEMEVDIDDDSDIQEEGDDEGSEEETSNAGYAEKEKDREKRCNG